tara:strand:- start:360 stop:1565 length:1206 start_codon:yes stop_codon:yes gene_type:complete
MAATTKRRKKKTVRRAKVGIGGIKPDKGYVAFSRAVHATVNSKEYVNIVKGYVRKAYNKSTAQAILANPDYLIQNSGLAAWCYWSTVYPEQPFVKGDFGPCAGAKNDEDQFNQSTEYYTKKLDELAESGKALVKEKKAKDKVNNKVYKPSIQERMREQLSDIIGEFELWVDLQPSSDIPKFFDWLKANNVAQAHISKIRSYYEPIAAEYQLLQNMPTASKFKKMTAEEQDSWEQIKEGYGFLSKQDITKYTKFFDSLFGDLDAYAALKKASRATRKPKPKSADKLVSKLKYKTDDPRYKTVSIDPTKIIGATELWVFNTKNRKLGKYVAVEHGEFSIKGTTLQFFDEALSVQKTLRKPEQQLKEFGKAGKVALRKFLQDIKATETKMNGRFNEHTVLLKVS